MIGLWRCALALPFALALWAGENGCQPNAPCYSAGGIVNTASNLPGALAPFTYISIFGTNLSEATLARGDLDPYSALGGVQVVADRRQPAFVSYVSPGLVIVLLPPAADLKGPQVTLRLTRQSVAGPEVALDIRDCAPTLFQLDQATPVAAHPLDWTVVTQDRPARAGELVVLYATGLGRYVRSLAFLEVPTTADSILRRGEFEVLLDGQLLDDRLVHYAGAAPGVLGIYEIDLELPANVGRDPEIRIKLGDQISPPGVRLPVK
jgi:uncharacterized protein (TIGR03437 family)